MADAIVSYRLPTEPKWEEFIYLLETTDPVLGYNPLTATDGPANTQGLQLGNRTLWLRRAHDFEHVDGHHQLKDGNFADGTQIPESCLALDFGTRAVEERAAALKADAESENMRADRLASVSLTFCGTMLKLIPLAQEYSGAFCVFELFSDSVSLMPSTAVRVLDEIRGDDSLDVESTKGLIEGETYFITDLLGNDIEEVTLMSVLSDKRLRFTTDLRVNRDTGWLSRTTLVPDEHGGATANGSWSYISEWTTVTENAVGGRLFIHMDNVPVSLSMQVQSADGDWMSATLEESRAFTDNTIDHVFVLPAGKLRFRIDCQGRQHPYTVHYIAVKPVINVIWLEDVRRPEVTGWAINGGRLTLQGNGYASLYGVPQKGFEARLSTSRGFDGAMSTHSLNEPVTRDEISIPQDILDQGSFYVQIRYVDVEGTPSRWSIPTRVGA